MKKPAKAATKKVVKNQKPQKKIAKPIAKKAAPAKAKQKVKVKTKPKIVVKPKAKAPIKRKVVAKKVITAKKVVKKEVQIKKKVTAKVVHVEKTKAKQPQMDLMKKRKINIVGNKETSKKDKEAAKLLEQKQKELAKKLKLQEKEDAKEAAKLEKEAAKKAKLKGKSKGNSFEEDEELEAKPRHEEEEEEDDNFSSAKPVKVKMTFDEEFEEEVPVKKKKASVDENLKDSLAEEILALTDEFTINDVFTSIRSMELFKLDNDECVIRGCDNPSTTNGYCRFHYLKLWKDVKKKEQILQEGKLAKIIEDLVRKYPMKYIEAIVQDLADDKSFNHVLKDLDIETEEADLENFDDEDLLDDDQDIAFETKVVKPSFDD